MSQKPCHTCFLSPNSIVALYYNKATPIPVRYMGVSINWSYLGLLLSPNSIMAVYLEPPGLL